MVKLFSKITLALIFWGIFILVVFNIPYPNSLTEANLFQLSFFFLSLFLALILTISILLNLITSTIISLGLILLLVLTGFDLLNVVTGIITLLIVGLLLSYFKNIKGNRISFRSSIPKIKLLNKFKQVKLSSSRRRKR